MRLFKCKSPTRRQVEMRLVNKRLWKRGVISNKCDVCGTKLSKLICPRCTQSLPEWKEKGDG